MFISVLAVCFNEEQILPFFLRHYEKFADRITVYDNYSTDGSWDVLNSHPLVQAVRYDTGGLLSNDTFLSIKNHSWKKDVGGTDWQVVCDIDELIWHHDIRALLARYDSEGVTFPRVAGFNMAHDRFPEGDPRQLWEFIKLGAPFYRPSFNKRAVFKPTERNLKRKGLRDINYRPGCHSCAPDGTVVESGRTDIRLLHYRCFGPEHGIARARLNLDRMAAPRNESGTRSWYQNQIKDYEKFAQLNKIYDVFGPDVDLNAVFVRGGNKTRTVKHRAGQVPHVPAALMGGDGDAAVPVPLRLKGLRGVK